MLESITSFIFNNAAIAHWFFFGALLLAGLNIPISADLVLILSAVLAANVVPENVLHLYLSVYIGCCLSAWIAYWLGRTVSSKLCQTRWFATLLSKERLAKIRSFYGKYGFMTLAVGRFIPFGVRNGIFMSAGISKLSFPKFILWDAIACLVWSSACFFLFYTLGQNYEVIYEQVKTWNLFIFAAFSMTLIGFIWYKVRKKAKRDSPRDLP